MTAWVLIVGTIATTGWFAHFSPPRLLLALVPTLIGVFWIARRQMAFDSIPLWLLVGFQSFRIVVELLIHQAVIEGVAPPQISTT